MITQLEQITAFYRRLDENGLCIFDRWDKKLNVGNAIVPSVYDDNYVPWLAKILDRFLAPRNTKLLSIGSGCGQTEQFLIARHPHLHIISTDLFAEAGKLCCSRNLPFVQCSAHMLPFVSGTFHSFIIDGVFGHLDASGLLEASMRELRRVGTNNCILCVSDDTATQTASNPRVALTRFSEIDFANKLRLLNLSPIEEHLYEYTKGSEGTIKRRVTIAKFI